MQLDLCCCHQFFLVTVPVFDGDLYEENSVPKTAAYKFLAEQEYSKGGHVGARVRRMWNSDKDKTSASEGLVLYCQK